MLALAEILKQAPKAAHHPHSRALHWIISLGAPGLFVVAIVDSSFIPLPLPGSTDLLLLVLVSHKQSLWIPFAAIATAGAVLGGWLSYRACLRGGEALLEKLVSAPMRTRITGWMERHAFLSIGLPALLPPPVPLTPFVIASGALQMPQKKFLTAFTTARAVRYLLVAWLAHHYGRQLTRWWREYMGEYSEPIAWTLVAITVIGGAILYWQWRKKFRAAQQGSGANAVATGIAA